MGAKDAVNRLAGAVQLSAMTTRAELIDRAFLMSPYALPPKALDRLAEVLEEQPLTATAETGCGASTTVFANYSPHHAVFAFNHDGVFEKVRTPSVEFVEGSTQLTLPKYDFQKPLDVVLLDGPHAFPFCELEYYYFYQRIRQGGVLILDDIQIPTVHRMFNIVRSDAMWELESVIHRTAFLRRTDADLFPPHGDNWDWQAINKSEMLRYTWRDDLTLFMRRIRAKLG